MWLSRAGKRDRARRHTSTHQRTTGFPPFFNLSTPPKGPAWGKTSSRQYPPLNRAGRRSTPHHSSAPRHLDLVFCDQHRRESGKVASATLGRSEDVCEGAGGGRCVVSSQSPFRRVEVNKARKAETFLRDCSGPAGPSLVDAPRFLHPCAS